MTQVHGPEDLAPASRLKPESKSLPFGRFRWFHSTDFQQCGNDLACTTMPAIEMILIPALRAFALNKPERCILFALGASNKHLINK